MRSIAAIVALGLGTGDAWADPFAPLDGGQIRAALQDATLDYAEAHQVFYESGRTLYVFGRPSWGYWDIRGDQYCSQWPPQQTWTCYDVDQSADGTKIRFRGFGDDVTVGTFRD